MAFAREVKVGLFVMAGLAVSAMVIFMIGEERRAFGSKETYFSVFKDVQGLRRGSPVRMGGVDIGSVADVSYGENAKDASIFVKMSIVAGEARRIRKDSISSIEGKGLLGDKMIVISVGNPSLPQIPPGERIESKTGDDMSVMITRLGAVSAQAERVMGNLERTTGMLADPELHDDLKASVGSLANILGAVERREGYVGRLFGDPAEAERLSRTFAHLEQVSGELTTTTRNINQIIGQIQHGPGLAHEVVYGNEGQRAVAQLGQAAEELGTTLKGVREGNGLARSLLFGDARGDRFAADLNDVSHDLKQIVADLKAGRGTLGALLVDPSVYEDLKLVLGNVERNKALRALVRYSIRQEEASPKVSDPDAPSNARSGTGQNQNSAPREASRAAGSGLRASAGQPSQAPAAAE
ncbi:MAG TPA: MlaD family protein [Polyangiaceae bacterium]|nr:MlaD family protein [Polyangiaceae bacterium]